MFEITKQKFSISDIISEYENKTINLSPRYQRTGGIWDKAKNQLLIDSIFNGIDLPKFYLHLFPEEGNIRYKYAVVDGKQRILAITSFYKDEFPLSKDFVFWGESKVNIAGMYFSEIEQAYPRIAGQFLLFSLDFTIIDTDEVRRIDNMFIRINEGVRVNSAEKRTAHGGKLIDLIAESCARNSFFSTTLAFPDYRKAYQELFLKIYVLERFGHIVNLNDKCINDVLESDKDCSGSEASIAKEISARLETIASVFEPKSKLFKKNNVILFYWFFRCTDAPAQTIADFIQSFENARLNSDGQDYQRFNELTRQGIYQKNKMEERLEILKNRFSVFNH